MLVAALSVSSLYFEKDQRFRGLSNLILDDHATRLDTLPNKIYSAFMHDLRQSVYAIREAVNPDHINVALLGNSCPHLHWSIAPRYKSDSRWGKPIWEDATLQEMRSNPVAMTEAESSDLLMSIRQHL